MKKIPTLFRRDPDNRALVVNELAVELPNGAVPTVKWDGSCVMYDGNDWWKRREVKPGKPVPEQFDEVDFDEVTGKRQGWVPIGDGPDDRWFRAAIEDRWFRSVTVDDLVEPGTFEAVGPHFQGNPHHLAADTLERHGELVAPWGDTTNFDTLYRLLRTPIEGIVWWFDGAPVAKLKRRDFGLAWPVNP